MDVLLPSPIQLNAFDVAAFGVARFQISTAKLNAEMKLILNAELIILVIILFAIFPSLVGRDLGAALVIGGTDAKAAAWPWQVALLSSGRFKCGGTLINMDTVLTAAHCLLGQRYEDLVAVMGENNRYYTEGSEQKISVQGYTVHPYFKGNYIGGKDIALLHLSRNVSLTSFVQPIRHLATEEDKFDDSSIRCYITGWGVSSVDALGRAPCPKSGGPYQYLSPRLQEAEIAVINQLKCNSKRYWDGLIKTTNVCAFYKTVAACEGDSGSPLVCKVARGVVLVGVTSWGSISCQNYPTVFTAVSKFRNWIDISIQEARSQSIIDPDVKDGIISLVMGDKGKN